MCKNFKKKFKNIFSFVLFILLYFIVHNLLYICMRFMAISLASWASGWESCSFPTLLALFFLVLYSRWWWMFLLEGTKEVKEGFRLMSSQCLNADSVGRAGANIFCKISNSFTLLNSSIISAKWSLKFSTSRENIVLYFFSHNTSRSVDSSCFFASDRSLITNVFSSA